MPAVVRGTPRDVNDLPRAGGHVVHLPRRERAPMAANVVGSVHRTDLPNEVVLHVDRSRAARRAAVRLMLVLLLCLMGVALAIYINADDLRHPRGHEAIWPCVWGFGALALLWWQIGRNIPPLLRTASGRVTIRIDTKTLEVLTRRRDGVTSLPWASGGIDDVVI